MRGIKKSKQKEMINLKRQHVRGREGEGEDKGTNKKLCENDERGNKKM